MTALKCKKMNCYVYTYLCDNGQVKYICALGLSSSLPLLLPHLIPSLSSSPPPPLSLPSCSSLLPLLLQEFDEVELLIDGGPSFEVGATAVIRCHYTGLIVFSQPHFRINKSFYESTKLKIDLSQYQHNYSFGVEGEQLWANYSLMLPNVQMADNGTTYQCILDSIDLARRYHSNKVTLIVNGKIAFN